MRISLYKADGDGWRPFGTVDADEDACVVTWLARDAESPGEFRCFVLTGTSLEGASIVQPPSIDEVIAAGCEEWAAYPDAGRLEA